MEPVTDMRWCPYEAQTMPAGHHCIGDNTPAACPTEAGHPCGACPACIAAQSADLGQHGHPEDIGGPA